MKNRILVTGGAGYIGCIVVRRLISAGFVPIVLDTCNWGNTGLLEVEDSIEFISGDCRSSKDVVNALQGVTGVIHLAGIIGEQACKDNYLAHHTINVEATRTLVNCCTDYGLDLVKDFIFVSSCSVYGNTNGLHDEVDPSTPPNPISLYAEAKLRSENIILDVATKNAHFHPTILRLTTAFGWSPRPRLDLVTNLFAYKALSEGKISVTGGGAQYRSLVHVDDIASAIVHTLCSPRYLRSRRIFHVGDERNNITINEIAEIVKKVLPKTEINAVNEISTDRRDYRINCQLIQNVLGWKATWSVEDGVRDIIKKLDSSNEDWNNWVYRNDQFKYS